MRVVYHDDQKNTGSGPDFRRSLLLLPALAAEPAGETVTIRNDGDNTYYEFRRNGKISEIKVVPKVGKPYYLIPTHGEDGDFMRKDNPEMRVPSWVIFRW